MIRKTIVGYADKLSVTPGERIQFKVSTYGPNRYSADIVKIISGDDSPGGTGFRAKEIETHITGEYPGLKQEIHAGSYVEIPRAPVFRQLESFSLMAMIWPSTPHSRAQGILGTWSEPNRCGLGLLIDETGALAIQLGNRIEQDEIFATGVPLYSRRWYFVAGSFDHSTNEVRLYQEQLPVIGSVDAVPGRLAFTYQSNLSTAPMTDGPFLIAAWQQREAKDRRLVGGHFNGKIDSPRLVNRVLSLEEMKIVVEHPRVENLRPAIVAAWDFSRDIPSDRVTDLSQNNLHGRTVNLPARAMTGYNWSGTEHNWRQAPDQYGAIHFHDDDLCDAGWKTDFELEVPGDAQSGIYAARLRADESEDYIPFFIRPHRGTATAKAALLASTVTYMAYANSRLDFEGGGVEVVRGRLSVLMPEHVFLMEHPEFGLSLYDHHSDGSGVCYSSRLRPILDMRPKTDHWSLNADTHITDWLEETGFRYDVITDEDLHLEGADLLECYQTIITGTHPEYYSEAMLDGLKGYVTHGGRLMYLGGNGFYWVTVVHPEKPWLIEVRRTEDGTRAWKAEPGEYYHSFTGEYGGLWLRRRRQPNLLVGVGFSAQGFDVSSYYRRKPGSFDPRADFIFEGIEDDELIGDFGIVGGGAAGDEIDRFERRLGSPRHSLVLATSENHSACYTWVKEEMSANFPGTSGVESPFVRADMVFFECPGGGAIFSTGSIAWSGSLSHNNYQNNVSRITSNVLRRFLADIPFEVPED